MDVPGADRRKAKRTPQGEQRLTRLRLILDLLSQEPMTRAQLMRHIGCTMGCIGADIANLLQADMIEPAGGIQTSKWKNRVSELYRTIDASRIDAFIVVAREYHFIARDPREREPIVDEPGRFIHYALIDTPRRPPPMEPLPARDPLLAALFGVVKA